jgi:hypothetical protein
VHYYSILAGIVNLHMHTHVCSPALQFTKET